MARAENDVAGLWRLFLDKFMFILYRNNIGFDKINKVKYGLKKGSGDYIGYRSIIITPDMVGKRIARFTSVETKAGTDMSDDQLDWHDAVLAAGGISIIARGSAPEQLPDCPLPDAGA